MVSVDTASASSVGFKSVSTPSDRLFKISRHRRASCLMSRCVHVKQGVRTMFLTSYGHLPFMSCHIHSEPIMMTPTAISDEVREGRMINFNFSLWVLRKWNDALDVNEKIPDVWDL